MKDAGYVCQLDEEEGFWLFYRTLIYPNDG